MQKKGTHKNYAGISSLTEKYGRWRNFKNCTIYRKDMKYLNPSSVNYLCPDRAEIEGVLYSDNFIEWHSDLFLTSNEYVITVVYPLGKDTVI